MNGGGGWTNGGIVGTYYAGNNFAGASFDRTDVRIDFPSTNRTTRRLPPHRSGLRRNRRHQFLGAVDRQPNSEVHGTLYPEDKRR